MHVQPEVVNANSEDRDATKRVEKAVQTVSDTEHVLQDSEKSKSRDGQNGDRDTMNNITEAYEAVRDAEPGVPKVEDSKSLDGLDGNGKYRLYGIPLCSLRSSRDTSRRQQCYTRGE